MSRAILGPKTSQRILRELVFFLIWLSGFPLLLHWRNRKSPRILVFHGFYDDIHDENSVPVNLWVHQPISLLDRQLQHLNRHYRSVKTAQIQDWLCNEQALPDHAVGIHVDDGLKNVFTLAAPKFLKAGWTFDLGLIATAYSDEPHTSWEVWVAAAAQIQYAEDAYGHYFLDQATKFIRADAESAEKVVIEAQNELNGIPNPFQIAPDMKRMTWEEIKKLHRQGFGLMNHTLHHEVLNKLSDQAIEENLQEANAIINHETGESCNAFVYPTGVVDQRIANAVEKAGFPYAYTLMNGMINHAQPRQLLPRIGIPSAQGYYEFVCRVAGVHAFFLSLKNKP